MIKQLLSLACFSLLVFAGSILPAVAQDGAALWQRVSEPAFPAAPVQVQNAAITRDRIRITLASGSLQFTEPALDGRPDTVFGAAFRGHGRIQIQPTDTLEAQQLQLLTGQSSLDMQFSEAVFVFTDETHTELTQQATGPAPADSALRSLYLDRQKEREDHGAELLPRLFKGLLSSDRKRTALFAADLKTSEKGWMHVRFDALELEEITVGRWTDWGRARLFDTWMSFAAGGRSSAEAFSDPLAREDFLIRSYQINAHVTGDAELAATTQVSLERRATGERVLLFEFDANLRVTSIKDSAGNALPFFQPRDPKDRNQSYGDYVAVVLPEPTQTGPNTKLEFQYAGKRVVRQVGPGNFFCQSYGWYPTRPNSFAARADFEMNFRFPKRYSLVATGNKISETTDGDEKISTWKSDLPLAVAGFAFGDYKLHQEKVGAVDLEVYANNQPDDFMRSIEVAVDNPLPGMSSAGGPRAALGSLSPARLMAAMAQEMANTLRIFELYFGPYPYKRLAITNIPYSYGQGWPMLIYLSALSFLDSTQRHQLGIRDHTLLTDFFRAHESSHQWWGHRVGWKTYHDQWLSEGFAQFSGNLYVQFRKNEREYLERLRKDKELLLTKDRSNRVYESLGPMWMGRRLASSDSPSGYSVVAYNKGGLILHMLRRLLWNPQSKEPDDRFIAMMQDFCHSYHNRPASTEDFKAIVEKHMTSAMDVEGNRRMDWFFRQYVYGIGLATYQFSYSVSATPDGKWQVSGTVKQSGAPVGWKDALPLYAQVGENVRRLGVITVRESVTTFDFLLPFKPDKLSLNNYEDTLANIKQ